MDIKSPDHFFCVLSPPSLHHRLFDFIAQQYLVLYCTIGPTSSTSATSPYFCFAPQPRATATGVNVARRATIHPHFIYRVASRESDCGAAAGSESDCISLPAANPNGSNFRQPRAGKSAPPRCRPYLLRPRSRKFLSRRQLHRSLSQHYSSGLQRRQFLQRILLPHPIFILLHQRLERGPRFPCHHGRKSGLRFERGQAPDVFKVA